MGDRRAAALQQSEHFRNIQIAPNIIGLAPIIH